MSEEEIIDIAERIADFGWSDYDDFEKNKKAIKGLLELYNKEKEKNGTLLIELASNNYISKDKIKEKIKELENECDKCDFKESNICEYFETNKNCTIQFTIKNLKEILDECNN